MSMSTLVARGPAVANLPFAGNEQKALLLALSEKRSELQAAYNNLEDTYQGFAEPDQDLKQQINDLGRRISNLDTMETRLNDGSFINKCRRGLCPKPIGFERLRFDVETRDCDVHSQ